MTQDILTENRLRIGAEVRAAREKAGLSLRELADKSDIAFSHIGRIEHGKYNISIDTLTRLGEILGFKVSLV